MPDSSGRVVFQGLEPFSLNAVQRGGAHGDRGSVTMTLYLNEPKAPDGYVVVTAQMKPKTALLLANELYDAAQAAKQP